MEGIEEIPKYEISKYGYTRMCIKMNVVVLMPAVGVQSLCYIKFCTHLVRHQKDAQDEPWLDVLLADSNEGLLISDKCSFTTEL